MKSYKNIITWIVKILIGAGSFAIIYWRLKDDLTPEKINSLQLSLTKGYSYLLLFVTLLLVPLNWGIESYKWKLITGPLETISYSTASKSVYAALCVGNLAPGRATEFLAKILFFKPVNRPTVALLHFVNGMFQLSLTILFGLIALAIRFNSGSAFSNTQFVLIILFCALLLSVFIFSLLRFDALQKWVLGFFKNKLGSETLPYSFTKRMVTNLFLFSFLRYLVFTTQFLFMLNLFYTGGITLLLLASVSIYFLLTTALPMISLIEPAIRAAIALLVFGGMGIQEIPIITAAVLVWLINIALPSLAGYFIILKENFEFSSFRK